MFYQRTIRERVVVEGIGLHTGAPARLTFCPAPADMGVHFVRRDLPGMPSVPVLAENVQATDMATTLGCAEFSVATIEHCMSALAALRIDNLIVELDGPEIPIGDGSARPFLEALCKVGMVEQEVPRKYAYITHPVYFGTEDKHAYILPYDGLRVSCTIEFSHPTIGKQKLELDINEHVYREEIAGARTFGFLEIVEALRARGLARGGSLDNAVVLDKNGVINPGGLRYADEFVRHKVLDALGDLVTVGMPLMGHVVLYKAGHDIMNRLVKKIMESPDSYRHMELGSAFPEQPDLAVGNTEIWG